MIVEEKFRIPLNFIFEEKSISLIGVTSSIVEDLESSLIEIAARSTKECQLSGIKLNPLLDYDEYF